MSDSQYRTDRRAEAVPKVTRVTKHEATESIENKLANIDLERERLGQTVRQKTPTRSFASVLRTKKK